MDSRGQGVESVKLEMGKPRPWLVPPVARGRIAPATKCVIKAGGGNEGIKR